MPEYRLHPFNLIHDMNTFRKKVLPFDPIPVVEGACKDRMCACMVFNALYASDLKCNKTTFRTKHVLTS